MPTYDAACGNLGGALLQAGERSGGGRMFAGAGNQSGQRAAHNSLGNALLQLGQVPEAIGQFEEAIRSKPELLRAMITSASRC